MRFNALLAERQLSGVVANPSRSGWITTTLLGGRRVLRVTVMNPRTGAREIEGTLDGLAEIARRLAEPRPA